MLQAQHAGVWGVHGAPGPGDDDALADDDRRVDTAIEIDLDGALAGGFGRGRQAHHPEAGDRRELGVPQQVDERLRGAVALLGLGPLLRRAPVPTGTPPGGIDLTAVELPARLGRLVAKLHLALATPSALVPEPTATVNGEAVRAWQAAARADVDAAVRLALTAPAGGLEPRELPGLLAAVDGATGLARRLDAGTASVTVQRVHGDLHIGRVLRWTGGLSVVGFDAEPHRLDPAADRAAAAVPAAGDGGELAPAARDLARLLASLAQVAGVAANRPEMPVAAPASWYRQAREQVLRAYRSALTSEGRPELLDQQLLAMFEAQERARAALVQASGHASDDRAPIG